MLVRSTALGASRDMGSQQAGAWASAQKADANGMGEENELDTCGEHTNDHLWPVSSSMSPSNS